MIRRIAIVGIVLSTAILIVDTQGVPTSVSAKCAPNRNNVATRIQDGWYRYPGVSQIGGVYADMFNYDPYVAPGPFEDDVVAYVELRGPGDYAVVGWQEKQVNHRYSFGEYSDASGVHFTQYTTPEPQPENTYSFYTALYDNYAPGYVTFYIAGRLVHIIPPLGWTPIEGAMYGEIARLASQMPGGINSPEVFRSSRIWYSGSWRSFGGTIWNPSSNYFGNAGAGPSSATLYIWDRYCIN